MKRNILALALGCAMALAGMAPLAAHAQATRTWISGVGDDVNPCSRTAPCKTFAGAISKTAAGGEIDTLDPGGFGAVTVTKAITLADEDVGEAGILVAGTNGITVNCATDPNCAVVVRGLVIDGGPLPTSNSLSGIRFVAGGKLAVQNTTIRNFNGGSPNGYGISFQPNSTASLFVDNCDILNNGNVGSTTGAGIYIGPQTSTAASATTVSISNTRIDGNVAGIRLDGSVNTTAGSAIRVSISSSDISGNLQGGVSVVSLTGQTPAVAEIFNTSVNNNGTGLNAKGALATIRVKSSTVTGNTNGLLITQSATMTSNGDNMIYDNLSGATSPTLSTTGPQ